MSESTVELFEHLVAIPSPSGRERRVATFIREWLGDRGVQADFDGAGAHNGSDCGNLIATIRGNPTHPRLLFVAHMDTVESGEVRIVPEISPDGIIRSQGNTILGADNKSAVAALMRLCAWAASAVFEDRPTIVAAFTCREESGRMGASLLDLEANRVDCGFCVDGNNAIGTAVIRTFGQRTFTLTITGRAAHAAASPEEGVNAIEVASRIIAALTLGRQARGGTLNIASIVGGELVHRLNGQPVPGDEPDPDRARGLIAATATNSVPDVVHVRGEVRAFSDEDIREILEQVGETVADVCDSFGAEHDWSNELARGIPPFPGSAESRSRALAREAAAMVPSVQFEEIVGPYTLEVNYLAPRCDVVALSSGGRNPHQASETITIEELHSLEAYLKAIVKTAVASADLVPSPAPPSR